MSLADYGWCAFFSRSLESLEPDLLPGRVIRVGGGSCRVITASGEHSMIPSGRMRHKATSAADLPAVGDWVVFHPVNDGGGRIEALLPRRTKLSRQVPGRRSEEQVVAANIDTAFVVMGLDGDFSPRRVERFLTLIREGGAKPVVVLNKLDLCRDHDEKLRQIEPVTTGVTTLWMSCVEGVGVNRVLDQIGAQETAVLVGSSGAGKSTLMNLLLGTQAQKTRSVRPGDGRGRHTTTHRELFKLQGGGMLIDNPGIREVQLWVRDGVLENSFEEVAELASRCRYRDCSHETEPGCAVINGVESGALDCSRLESFRNLRKEIRHLETRRDESMQREQKRKWKIIHKQLRKSYKKKWR